MTVAIVSHPDFEKHDTGDHPERAARYARAHQALLALPVEHVQAKPVTPAELLRVHPEEHGQRIRAFCEAGGGRIDEDTVASPASYDVALLSAGAAIMAVDLVASGKHTAAVALCRPPGHHALPSQTMGFCFFNNAALAARHAQQAYGLQRIVIVDWDLHHGNGTEAVFYTDPSVLYLSTHQHPNWPGTGHPEDTGRADGVGFTVNVPLPMGTGDAGYLRAFREVFTPVVQAFKPDMVIVSAGYDAHWRDPLGRMGLTVEGFAALTREIQGWGASCGDRLVFLMEGGYDLEALSHALVGTVETLLGRPVEDKLGPSPYREPDAAIERALANARAAQSRHWPLPEGAKPR